MIRKVLHKWYCAQKKLDLFVDVGFSRMTNYYFLLFLTGWKICLYRIFVCAEVSFLWPIVNVVLFRWRVSEIIWINIKNSVAIKGIRLYYYGVAQITWKSLFESFFRNEFGKGYRIEILLSFFWGQWVTKLSEMCKFLCILELALWKSNRCQMMLRV